MTLSTFFLLFFLSFLSHVTGHADQEHLPQQQDRKQGFQSGTGQTWTEDQQKDTVTVI